MSEVLLTAEQVARRCDVTPATVNRWCLRGWLPGAMQIGKARMWLIPEKAVDGFKRPSPGPKRRR